MEKCLCHVFKKNKHLDDKESSAHILIENISLKFSGFTKCHGFLYYGKSREWQPTLNSFLILVQINSSWRMFWSWVWQCYPSAQHRECGRASGPKGAGSGPCSATSSTPGVSGTQTMQHSWASSFTALDQRVEHILTLPRWWTPPQKEQKAGLEVCTTFLQVRTSPSEGFTGWAKSQVTFSLPFPVSLLWMFPGTLNSSAENWRWR